MAVEAGAAYIPIRPSFKGFAKAVNSQVTGAATKAGDDAGRGFGNRFRSALTAPIRGAAGAIVTSLGAIGAARVFGTFISEAREAEKVGRLTAAVIKSTGGSARVTAVHVERLATAISNKVGVDDEAIQSSQNLLLTFKNIRNETGRGAKIFDRTSKAIVDMTAGMNNGKVTQEGLKASTIQLGKALNDPIKGMAALGRVGIQFTESQKKQITQMVKSGNLLGAQKLILAEVESQFKGAASAAADPLQRLQTIALNLAESVGAKLLPHINRFATFLTAKGIPALKRAGDFLKLIIGSFTGKGADVSGFSANVTNAATTIGSVLRIAYDKVIQFLDALRDLGSIVLPIVGTVLLSTGRAVVSFAGWLRGGSVAAEYLRTVLKGLVIGFIAWKAIMIANRIVIATVTAAQWLLNAAMTANPIGLVVLAIAAMVAGVILLWKHSQTFRTIVMAAWNGIKTAALFAWNTVLKPIFNAIKFYIVNILIPQWKFIWSVVKVVWAGIMAAIRVAWAFIRPIFNFIKTIIKTVLVVQFKLLWNTVKIVWIGIQLQIKAAWAIIKVIFAGIKAFVRNILAPAFRWFWNSVIKPVWQGVSNTIRDVYNRYIQPVFNKFKPALQKVKDAFRVAVDAIRSIWKGIQDAAKKPVNFVIGVYNKGIVSLVNKIAKFAGINTRLGEIPRLAHGGVLPGYAPGRDKLLAAVSPGESVFRPEFTRAVGSGWVNAANKVARKRGAGGVRQWMGEMGGEGLAFSRGGVVPGFAGHYAFGGIIDRFIGGLKDWSILDPIKSVKGVLDRILGNVPGSGVMRDVVNGIPPWIGKSILGWAKNKLSFGGPGVARALSWAKAQAGKPYVWGGVGPRGYDCSGFMSAITNVIKGRPPHRRLFTTHSFGALTGPGGFIRGLPSGFRVGVTDAGVGHMAGTLGRTAVESSGSAGVRVGGGARGATNGLFSRRYGLRFDSGGYLPPGLSMAYNGTGRPEPVLTSRDWNAINAMASQGSSSSTNYNIYPRTLNMTTRDLEALQRQQEARARVGRPH